LKSLSKKWRLKLHGWSKDFLRPKKIVDGFKATHVISIAMREHEMGQLFYAPGLQKWLHCDSSGVFVAAVHEHVIGGSRKIHEHGVTAAQRKDCQR
jgi:hypothetical protein